MAIWGNAHADHSHSSFSSAIKHTETTPSKRRRGSDGLARLRRNGYDLWADEPSSGSHSRSRTVDDAAGAENYRASGRITSQHPLRTSASHASSSAWTLDHETRPTMKRFLSDRDSGSMDEDRTTGQDGSLARDREMLVIVHEVSISVLYHDIWSCSSSRVRSYIVQVKDRQPAPSLHLPSSVLLCELRVLLGCSTFSHVCSRCQRVHRRQSSMLVVSPFPRLPRPC